MTNYIVITVLLMSVIATGTVILSLMVLTMDLSGKDAEEFVAKHRYVGEKHPNTIVFVCEFVMTNFTGHYYGFPVVGYEVEWEVKTQGSLWIALDSNYTMTNPQYSFRVSVSENLNMTHRFYESMLEDKIMTYGILSGTEWRRFWMKWHCGDVKIGLNTSKISLISWKDPEPPPIHYVGFGLLTPFKAEVPIKIYLKQDSRSLKCYY